MYFAASDLGEDRGPFPTFEEALRKAGLASYGGPPSLRCSEVDEQTLLRMITIHEPGPTEVNGQLWEYDEKPGQFRPYEAE